MTAGATSPSARAVALDIERLWACLTDGGVGIVPLDVAYAICAMTADGVRRIFAAKQRPSFNPLISHVASIEDAFALGRATPFAKRLAAAFWPGPMTLILERQTERLMQRTNRKLEIFLVHDH